MVIFEALNALYGDCLLLRYSGKDGQEKVWIVDGGPKSGKVDGKSVAVWKDVLLPRLDELHPNKPMPIALGMVSHIDDDHINGLQRLTNVLTTASPARPPAVKFERFWFNAFDDIVGPSTPKGSEESTEAATASLVGEMLPHTSDEDAQAVLQSVGQGINLRSDLRALRLAGNAPLNHMLVAKPGQSVIDIEGAEVTLLGPLQRRLDKLRIDWAKAAAKTDNGARQAALQDLLLPDSALDNAVPNLSSIVVLVEIGGKRLLLTGDARGDDIVKAWTEIGLEQGPVAIDLLKVPHHGSVRNNPESFLTFFAATHYVFSANGKYDNPDPPVVEAVVKLHGHRPISLDFTNSGVTWSKPYSLEKNNKRVANLAEMIPALREAYPGPWKASFRNPAHHSIVIDLA